MFQFCYMLFLTLIHTLNESTFQWWINKLIKHVSHQLFEFEINLHKNCNEFSITAAKEWLENIYKMSIPSKFTLRICFYAFILLFVLVQQVRLNINSITQFNYCYYRIILFCFGFVILSNKLESMFKLANKIKLHKFQLKEVK